jgi:hypothetical protein
MPLEQYDFGIGGIFALRTDISNPTPVRFGTVQDVTVELSYTVKTLRANIRHLWRPARAGLKITAKAKVGQDQCASIQRRILRSDAGNR